MLSTCFAPGVLYSLPCPIACHHPLGSNMLLFIFRTSEQKLAMIKELVPHHNKGWSTRLKRDLA